MAEIPDMCVSLPQVQVGESAASASGTPTVAISHLTSRMAAHDESAYRTFFELYFGRLQRYLLVVTHGAEDDAREALQLTLLRLVRHIRRFDSEAVFWSWLTVLARSSVTDEQRKHRRYFALLDRFFWWSKSAESPEDSESRLEEILEYGLASLSTEDRALIESKYFDRQSVSELAQHHQLTEKAIESRLVRIRQKLKQVILNRLKHE